MSTTDTAAPPRILLTKSFIDSYDRAIATIALALRDAAMEVVLIDYELPEDVVNVADARLDDLCRIVVRGDVSHHDAARTALQMVEDLQGAGSRFPDDSRSLA